ncbi:MAG: sugar phosphate nucleotidyltransferase [Pseudomonadota bacterium]
MSQAVLLAAGMGARARPLSLRCPKPLLRIGQKSLLERHLDKLENNGFQQILVTCSYHSATLRLLASQRKRGDMRVAFSHEGDVPLETAGGLWRLLPRLENAPFTLVNGDVWTEFDLRKLAPPPPGGMHLLMVPNPPHNPRGDYHLDSRGLLHLPVTGRTTLTYAGIAHIDPACDALTASSVRLPEVFRTLIQKKRLTAQVCDAAWFDVGNPAAFVALNESLVAGSSAHYGQ